MAKVIFKHEAIKDLNNIWKYTFENWSEKQADKYYAMLKKSCEKIGKNPEIGKKYNTIFKNLLGLHSGRHIIFYHAMNENNVEIIRILHQRMDLKIKLEE